MTAHGLLIELPHGLVGAGGGQAGDDADGRRRDVVGGREVRHDVHGGDAQRQAADAADDGDPLAVHGAGLDGLPDQQADDGDGRHPRDAQGVDIHTVLLSAGVSPAHVVVSVTSVAERVPVSSTVILNFLVLPLVDERIIIPTIPWI